MNTQKIADYTTRKSYQQNYAKDNREAINARKRVWRKAQKLGLKESKVETDTQRQATILVIGNYYRHLGNRFGMVMCERPLKYCGVKEYNGRVNHQFWDDKLCLMHWLEPDQMS